MRVWEPPSAPWRDNLYNTGTYIIKYIFLTFCHSLVSWRPPVHRRSGIMCIKAADYFTFTYRNQTGKFYAHTQANQSVYVTFAVICLFLQTSLVVCRSFQGAVKSCLQHMIDVTLNVKFTCMKTIMRWSDFRNFTLSSAAYQQPTVSALGKTFVWIKHLCFVL